MIDAVKAADSSGGDQALKRLSNIERTSAFSSQDEIEAAKITQLTAVSGGEADSLHRLVMDLHKMCSMNSRHVMRKRSLLGHTFTGCCRRIGLR